MAQEDFILCGQKQERVFWKHQRMTFNCMVIPPSCNLIKVLFSSGSRCFGTIGKKEWNQAHSVHICFLKWMPSLTNEGMNEVIGTCLSFHSGLHLFLLTALLPCSMAVEMYLFSFVSSPPYFPFSIPKLCFRIGCSVTWKHCLKQQQVLVWTAMFWGHGPFLSYSDVEHYVGKNGTF